MYVGKGIQTRTQIRQQIKRQKASRTTQGASMKPIDPVTHIITLYRDKGKCFVDTCDACFIRQYIPFGACTMQRAYKELCEHIHDAPIKVRTALLKELL